MLVVGVEAAREPAIGQVAAAEAAVVDSARSGEDALERPALSEYDAILIDTRLPGMSGFEACRQIRARSDVPVLLVGAQPSAADPLLAYDHGADDYLAMPLEAAELERHVRALVRRRRAPAAADELTGPDGLVMRLRAHEVCVDGRRVDLTPKEFDLLRLLLTRRGEVLTSDEISMAVWGYETFGSRNFLEAHVSRLRSKLARAGARDVVTTVRGVGYVVDTLERRAS